MPEAEGRFPKKAEDLVEDMTAKRTPEDNEEIEAHATLQEQVEHIRHRIDPNYRAKSRAEYLSSMDVEERWSPANRLKIDPPKGDPNTYRWCHDRIRDRFGPEGWEPVKDMEHAKKICPSSHLRVGSDGRIYSGDSYLCKQPKENVEKRNAMIYQQSVQKVKDAEAGRAQSREGGETMDQIHSRTTSGDDPIGVRYSSKLRDDNP